MGQNLCVPLSLCVPSSQPVLAFNSEDIDIASENNIMFPDVVHRHDMLKTSIETAPESFYKTMLLNSTPISVNYTTNPYCGFWTRVKKNLLVHIRAEKTLRELFSVHNITHECEIGLDYGQNFTLGQMLIQQ